jgi:hypothetical protein
MDILTKKSIAKVLVLGISAIMVTACQKTVNPLETFMPQQQKQQPVEKKHHPKAHKKHHHKKHHHKHHHHKKHYAAKKEVKSSVQEQSMAPAQ